MNCDACLNNNEKTKVCQHHQQIRNNLILIAAVSFVFLFVLQVFSNIRLTSELNEVRKNINFLLKKCHEQSHDFHYYDSDVTNDVGNQENNRNENNEVLCSLFT